MSYSRSVKPQIIEILAIETLYLPAVVLAEKIGEFHCKYAHGMRATGKQYGKLFILLQSTT